MGRGRRPRRGDESAEWRDTCLDPLALRRAPRMARGRGARAHRGQTHTTYTTGHHPANRSRRPPTAAGASEL
eukprot:84921-Prymnesium_polylepis.1